MSKCIDSPDIHRNVHDGLLAPEDGEYYLVKGDFIYFHYCCDGLNDRGWGCGYRTLQSICSWLKEAGATQSNSSTPEQEVPSIPDIQKALVAMNDKPKKFINSRDWIGSFECCLCLDYFYNIPCKIIHIQSGKDLPKYSLQIQQHFTDFGSPIMMGGDNDASSKGIFGICRAKTMDYLLIIDPHFPGRVHDKNQLQDNGWVKWVSMNEFMASSFYNLCLPQFKKEQ